MNNSVEMESIFIHNIIITPPPFIGSPLTCIKNLCVSPRTERTRRQLQFLNYYAITTVFSLSLLTARHLTVFYIISKLN